MIWGTEAPNTGEGLMGSEEKVGYAKELRRGQWLLGTQSVGLVSLHGQLGKQGSGGLARKNLIKTACAAEPLRT